MLLLILIIIPFLLILSRACLVIEEEKKDIKIISIAPGWIDTDEVKKMNPVYLREEISRTGQKDLLKKELLVKYIIENINNYKNGEVIEIKNLEV